MLLARAKATRNLAVTGHLPDGSYLARLDDMPVRMIDVDVAMTGADGTTVAGKYRLITTLAGHRACPAAALVRLYNERRQRPARPNQTKTLRQGSFLEVTG